MAVVEEVMTDCGWLLFIESGSGGGGGSDADDAGDIQLLSQQLAASQSQPDIHDVVPASTVHSALVTHHVSGHCHQH